MSPTQFAVSCPCRCGEILAASDAGFSATTVEIPSCAKAQAAGGLVPSSIGIRKSLAYSLAVPAAEIRHMAGLVSFAA